MDYKVVFSRQAERDLFEAVSFVARLHPVAAEKAGHSLVDAAESLGWMPYRGPSMQKRPNLRKLVHLPYHLIIYRVNEPAKLVEILRIWDGRQSHGILNLD